jgi:hypothetical protein
VGVCCSNYESILTRLNLSTLHSRQQHLDALFLVNVFKSKISCSSIFDSVSIQIPATTTATATAIAITLHLWLITFSMSVCQLDVFLLPVLFARASTFLAGIIFH